MRLIDTDVLESVAVEYQERHPDFPLTRNEYKLIDRFLFEYPTIEAEPVKHGRWIPVDSYSAFGGSEEVWRVHGNPTAYHYCSECKEQSRRDEFGDEILSKYCPNCGAKMDGGDA